ncbi:hypothetical protein BT93_D2048 [Corymbia citriodora subsp. variegata]|nr:hypothetical protein BT93_D2048 [Corymbia citriodora subsp. variegata]
MAKLPLSLLLLFFLIAFSHSLTPSALPNDDVAGRDLPGFEAKSTPTILLPSEKVQPEAAAAVQIDPVAAADGSDTPKKASHGSVLVDRPASEPEKIASVPLRTITFRPYDHGGLHDRTVPLSLRFPFRHGGRGCRHGRRQFRPRSEGREISFGNDMILSGEKPGHDLESRAIERQMAGRWIRIHHRKPRFGFADVAWKEDEDMMKRPDRHHEEREEEEEEREHHHRRWKEDKDMMKRPHRPEEREDDDEEREHHHRRWDMMKRPHRPEEHEDDDEEREHHHHRYHGRHFRRHHDHEDKEEERHGGEGIFKSIRKFLDHF